MLEAAIVLQTDTTASTPGHYHREACWCSTRGPDFSRKDVLRAEHLAALKSRLALTATVRRNGLWTNLPAAELVPGDIVKLSLGAVVAADVRLVEGSVQVDQSMLTGESIPVEAGPNFQTYAGAMIREARRFAEVKSNRNAHWRPVVPRVCTLARMFVSSQQKAAVRRGPQSRDV